MIEVAMQYILSFFNLLEYGRSVLYEKTAPWAEHRDKIVDILEAVEIHFKGYHPLTLILGFMLLSFIFKKLINILNCIWNKINSFEKIKMLVLNFLLKFKAGRDKLNKLRADVKNQVAKQVKANQFKKLEFRNNGQDVRGILNKLSAMHNSDKENIGGPHTKITGSIYITDSEIEGLVGEVVRMYAYSNLLHPDLFCSARFIESQMVKLGAELFNGDKDDCCGITTNGGSQSIMMAMFAYRNRGYKMGIEKPEMIIPVTAHAAFDKASEAFNIKLIKIPFDSNYQVDIKKLTRAINSNTIAIVGSFPNFPHGIHDDIEALSKVAVKYKVPLHVDACLGGLLIAFYSSANIKIPLFDFRLPGVTSISADYHKYGLCPKGVSLLLYSNREYRKHQYMIYPHFIGGLYPSPGFEGSRSAAIVAAAYAVILYLGKTRYVNQAKAIFEAVKTIKTHIKKNYELIEVVGDPKICSVAVIGPKAQLVFDQMHQKGWHMNRINFPSGFSFVITSANIANIENGTFLKDLDESYKYVTENKSLKLSEETRLYGMTLDAPESLVRENMDVLCDGLLD